MGLAALEVAVDSNGDRVGNDTITAAFGLWPADTIAVNEIRVAADVILD